MNKISLRIDIVSDVVCPWCYIGKRRLEKAIDQLKDNFEFDLHFLPFELNPNIPKVGVDQKEYLTNKFGGIDRYQQITEHVTNIAMQEGLNFNFEIQSISPNTFDAHRLVWLAGAEGIQANVNEAFMSAYFEQGKNLTNKEILIEIATQAGLDKDKASAVLDTDLYATEVNLTKQMLSQKGVTSVPFFIVNNQYGISGAQPVDVFINALRDISKN